MGEKPAQGDDGGKPLEVNLELPSFGLRRKRKERNASAAEETPESTSGDAPESAQDERLSPPTSAPAAAAPSGPSAPSETPAAPAAPAPVAPPVAAPDAAMPGASRFAPPAAAPGTTPVAPAATPETPDQPVAGSFRAEPAAPQAPAAPAEPAGTAAPATPSAGATPAPFSFGQRPAAQPAEAPAPVAEPPTEAPEAPVAPAEPSVPHPPLPAESAAPAPQAAPAAPAPAAPAPYAPPATDIEHTAVLPPVAPAQPASTPAGATAPGDERPMYVEERVDAKARKPKREKAPSVPKPPKDRAPVVSVPEMAAERGAAVVGLLVGLLACGLTWASLQGCEAIRGTSSCGGPGFLVLLVILLLLVVVGAFLLRLFRVPQPPSTSFLAVGLLSMLTLLFLASWIFEWWMVLVIPPLAAGCYVLAQWVTRHSAED